MGKEKRINVTVVYTAAQSVVECYGNAAFFFGRGWTEGMRISDLPDGVEFCVVADTVNLGCSVKGVWRADNPTVNEATRRATHTTLMSLTVPARLRCNLINLSAYTHIALVFSDVIKPSTRLVQHMMFLPLRSGELTPLFTSHYAPQPRDRVVEMSKNDPYHLPSVSVKRHYIYPAPSATRSDSERVASAERSPEHAK